MSTSASRDRLVSALRHLCAAEGGEQAVALAAGVSKMYLWQILHGTALPSGRARGVGPRLAEKLDRAFPGWTDEQHSPEGQRGAVAHPVSHPQQSDSPYIKWGDILSKRLPQKFRVDVPDDAMHPRVRVGHQVEFATGVAPKPGDGVLVRDTANRLYFRRFREARGGQWEAVPENDAYATLHSEADQLEVVAVLVAVHARWS